MLANLTNLAFAGGSISIFALLIAVWYYRNKATRSVNMLGTATGDLRDLAENFREVQQALSESRANEVLLQRNIADAQAETARVHAAMAEAQESVRQSGERTRQLLLELAALPPEEVATAAAQRVREMLE